MYSITADGGNDRFPKAGQRRPIFEKPGLVDFCIWNIDIVQRFGFSKLWDNDFLTFLVLHLLDIRTSLRG